MHRSISPASSETTPELTYSVLLQQHEAEKWSAQVLGWEESRVQGESREAALSQLMQRLTDYLARAEIVQIKVPNPGYENPWLKLAGKYKDDPPFEEMIAEIEADRQKLDTNLSDDEAI